MLLDKNVNFSNLNSVFILEFNNIAISSTAGYIICGSYEQNYYKCNNVFAIQLFHTYKITQAFYEIIKFFTDDNSNTSEAKAIVNLNNEVLYWEGSTLYKDSNLTEKKILFSLETQNTKYQFDVLYQNFQNFVIAIEKSIRGAFCFKFEDTNFVNYVLKKPISIILRYQDENEAFQCTKAFNEASSQQFSDSCKVEFLQYYLEIIIVLKKISSIIMNKNPRIEICKTFL
jgi:hypothetical protein